MKKAIYVFKRVYKMDYSAMLSSIKRIKMITGKNSLYIFFDMLFCGFKYMAGYKDYETFAFYSLTKEQRKTIITRGVNNAYTAFLNDKSESRFIDDKLLFNERYQHFLKRKWLNLSKTNAEEFKKFFKSAGEIIVKPCALSCGEDVEKLVYCESTNFEELFQRLLLNKQILAEEYVIQCSEMMRLFPYSVNTLRFVTIKNDSGVHIPFVCLRIGRKNNVVDNFNHGGLFTTVEKNGIISLPAVDKLQNVYEKHPETGTSIVGFQIPKFKEATELVKKLAEVTPSVRYTGWDIAITENGPVVIEGNPFPGHDVYASKILIGETGFGRKPEFDALVYGK